MCQSAFPQILPEECLSVWLLHCAIPAEEKESDGTTTCFKTGLRIIITISSCDAFYCSAMWNCDLEENGFCTA